MRAGRNDPAIAMLRAATVSCPALRHLRLAGCLAVSLGSALAGATAQQIPPSPESGVPVVYAAEVDSIIHPVSAEYMIETMDAADRSAAGEDLERPSLCGPRRESL